jgi:hypothetical protein
MGEAELRGPFDKVRNLVADGTVVKRTVFLGDDFLNCGALLMREALGQTVNDSHEGFGFLGHGKSFDPTISRVNGLYSPAPALGARMARIRRRRHALIGKTGTFRRRVPWAGRCWRSGRALASRLAAPATWPHSPAATPQGRLSLKAGPDVGRWPGSWALGLRRVRGMTWRPSVRVPVLPRWVVRFGI